MEWESESCTNRVLNLAIICATELEVSVVPPPHLFSFLSVIVLDGDRAMWWSVDDGVWSLPFAS
jgi:hypothetical protein